MTFEVRIAEKEAGDRSGDVYELIDTNESVRAEVWPHWGFNCLRWQIRNDDGRWADLLYAAADWESNPVPTRNGHPILFPFPGRLRDGKFNHEGKTFNLPHNDSTKQHAIHGFTPRNPWRVLESKATNDSAFVSGQFCLKDDLPEAIAYWPADFALTVTYRLSRECLRVEAHVANRGLGTLPFGLGYHPYFRQPGTTEPDISGLFLKANVSQLWESIDNLPTGKRVPVPSTIDFQHARPIGNTELDTVFTGAIGATRKPGEMVELAELSHPHSPGRVGFYADNVFRELVLFTPAHRQAIAIEPYTCAADAANLSSRGIDSGWLVLPPGSMWNANVEYRWLQNR